MSLEERLEALKARHSTLEDMIQQESSRPNPDDIEIHALKKEKLKIKDQMAGIATRH
ncbi:MAG: YdcH family protein [Rhodospirillales bacterium]